MSKKQKVNDNKDKLVKSINKNVRSSTRKLNPILKALVGKKVDIALKNLDFSDKRIAKDIKKHGRKKSRFSYKRFNFFR